MLKAAYCHYDLIFKQVAITSRESMYRKPTYFVKLWDDSHPEIFGIGECGLFRGLSCDDRPDYERVLIDCCRNIDAIDRNIREVPVDYPSIVFGLEMALADLKHGGRGILSENLWVEGSKKLQINGLVWMGSFDEMLSRVKDKIDDGFKCVKFKIGGIDFNRELELIRCVREHFPAEVMEIRLDANGGFDPKEALNKIEKLARFEIHSLEQPIRQHNWDKMREICRLSPIAIALDEELIGLNDSQDRERMVETVMPQYLILKPSLCGGIRGSNDWVRIAKSFGVGWWATSALESNVGLNAIAQWVACQSNDMVQGLGTGELYVNNIPSPIRLEGQWLGYDRHQEWDYNQLIWKDL